MALQLVNEQAPPIGPSPFDNIPEELKQRPNWCGAVKIDTTIKGKFFVAKQPINVTDDSSAASNAPMTWASFDQAVAWAHKDPDKRIIGYMVREGENVTIVDLDWPKDMMGNRLLADDPKVIKWRKIADSWIKAFDSYTETSMSGKGYHVVIKGALPKNAKLPELEVYCANHFIAMTGNKINGNCVIKDGQTGLDALRQQHPRSFGAPTLAAVSLPEKTPDEQIIEKMTKASNAADIRALWEGRWQDDYPSQSEADYALLSHLCFYTENNEQVARIFRTSELGKRKKANNARDPYIEQSIDNIRKDQPPPVDLSNFNVTPPKPVVVTKPSPVSDKFDYPMPPGFLGELTKAALGAAVMPVREYAIAAAIGSMLFCARQYNIEGSGLNQYMLVLGRTGTGKEDVQRFISTLYSQVRDYLTSTPYNMLSPDVFIGSSSFTSPPALHRQIVDVPYNAIVAPIGEITRQLKLLQDAGNENSVEDLLLNMWNKTGRYEYLPGKAYTSNANNIPGLKAPCFSMLGDATIDGFLSLLSGSTVSKGLLPRFMIIKSDAEAQLRNRNRITKLDPEMIKRIGDLMSKIHYMHTNNQFQDIELSTEAEELEFNLEKYKVAKLNSSDDDYREIFNRINQKALRLAGLVAVIEDPDLPIITKEIMQWAIDFIKVGDLWVASKFDKDEVGEGNNVQISKLRSVIAAILSDNPPFRYSKDELSMKTREKRVITRSGLFNCIHGVACFRNDKRGEMAAFKAALEALCDAGTLIPVPPKQMSETYQTTAKAYLAC